MPLLLLHSINFYLLLDFVITNPTGFKTEYGKFKL